MPDGCLYLKITLPKTSKGTSHRGVIITKIGTVIAPMKFPQSGFKGAHCTQLSLFGIKIFPGRNHNNSEKYSNRAPVLCGTVVRPSKSRRRLVASPMALSKVTASARLEIRPEVTRREQDDVGQHVGNHRRLQPPLPVEVARDQTEDRIGDDHEERQGKVSLGQY